MQWEIFLLKHLFNKRLPYLNNNPLSLLGERYAVEFFYEVDRQVLKQCYFDDIVLCRKVIHQLAFYGVIFNGGLHNYSILQNENDTRYLWKDTPGDTVFNPPIPLHVLQKAKSFGILYERDARGIPLASFERYQEDFPFEQVLRDYGFVLITYSELLEKLGCANEYEESGQCNILPYTEEPVGLPAPLQIPQSAEEDVASNHTVRPVKPVGCDSWGQVLDGLEELISKPGGGQSTAEVAERLKSLREKMETSEHNRTVEEFVDASGKIRLNGKVLDIPRTLQDQPIDSVEFTTCPQVPSKLKLLGFTTWGDLPYALDELLQNVTGIGPKTIEKFTTTTYEIFNNARLVQRNEATLRISYGALEISVPKELAEESLTQLLEYRRLLKPVLDDLYLMEIRTFHDLPETLQNLEQKVSKSQVFELFDSLCQAFDSELTLKSRIQSVLSSVFSIAREQKSKGIGRVLHILKTKFDMHNEGQHPTLKDVAGVLGITRERVRQILTRFWQRELSNRRCLIESVIHDVSHLGGVLPIKNFTSQFDAGTPFEQFVLNEVWDIYGLTSMEPDPLWSTLTKRDYESMRNELESDLQDVDEVPMYPTSVELAIQAFVLKRGLHQSCQKAFLQIVFAEMLAPWGSGYILKNLFKNEKILCVLREYPKGLAIHKEYDQFFARLDTLFPGEFNKNDRYIYAAIVNSEKAFMWGWGVYIHRDNTRIAKEDLAPIVAWIQQKFTDGVEQLSVFAAFNEFKDRLLDTGIPNEHALYSCLKYYYDQHFFMPKSPYVYPNYIAETRQNTAILEEFVKARGTNIPYTDLQDEFIERRGWKEYTLNQAITLSEHVIRTARGEYGVIDFYPLATSQSMEPLARFLERCVSGESKIVNIRLLFVEKQSLCMELQIGSDIALYSLMEKFFDERLVFPQYPHVQAKSADAHYEINNVQQLGEYIKNLHTSILRSDLKKEFIEVRCWTEKALENALRTNDRIYVLQQGSAAEYVHADTIAWNEHKQLQLEQWIRERIKGFANAPIPYGDVQRDLFRPEYFPELAADIHWTPALLKDRLKERDFIQFIGTTNAIFVPLPNMYEIRTDVEFLTFILSKEFHGVALLTAFQERLAELNYSRDGEIPRPYRAGNGNLPYILHGDKIQLKSIR